MRDLLKTIENMVIGGDAIGMINNTLSKESKNYSDYIKKDYTKKGYIKNEITALVPRAQSSLTMAEKFYEDLMLQLSIPEKKVKAHSEALQKAREEDLQGYKREYSWLRRAVLYFTGKKQKPNISKKTKLLESIVAMEHKIVQGNEGLSKLSENFKMFGQKYQGLIGQRTKLKERLREADAFFGSIEQNKTELRSIIDFFEHYASFSETERSEKWEKIQQLRNLDSKVFACIDVDSQAHSMALLDTYKAKKFELENAYKIKTLELGHLKRQYKALENQFALLLQQWQQSQEFVNPGFQALSELKVRYDVIDQYSEMSLPLLDIWDLIKDVPQLIAGANEAFMEVQEQLETRTCTDKGRIRVSSDLDGERALDSLELGDPREEISHLMNQPSVFDELME